MAQHKPMSEEESLRRSHSKWSNFKLALLCMVCAFGVSLLIAALATIGTNVLESGVVYGGIALGAVFSVLSIGLLARFKR